MSFYKIECTFEVPDKILSDDTFVFGHKSSIKNLRNVTNFNYAIMYYVFALSQCQTGE